MELFALLVGHMVKPYVGYDLTMIKISGGFVWVPCYLPSGLVYRWVAP